MYYNKVEIYDKEGMPPVLVLHYPLEWFTESSPNYYWMQILLEKFKIERKKDLDDMQNVIWRGDWNHKTAA